MKSCRAQNDSHTGTEYQSVPGSRSKKRAAMSKRVVRVPQRDGMVDITQPGISFAQPKGGSAALGKNAEVQAEVLAAAASPREVPRHVPQRGGAGRSGGKNNKAAAKATQHAVKSSPAKRAATAAAAAPAKKPRAAPSGGGAA